jgi:hypothetical protein
MHKPTPHQTAAPRNCPTGFIDTTGIGRTGIKSQTPISRLGLTEDNLLRLHRRNPMPTMSQVHRRSWRGKQVRNSATVHRTSLRAFRADGASSRLNMSVVSTFRKQAIAISEQFYTKPCSPAPEPPLYLKVKTSEGGRCETVSNFP